MGDRIDRMTRTTQVMQPFAAGQDGSWQLECEWNAPTLSATISVETSSNGTLWSPSIGDVTITNGLASGAPRAILNGATVGAVFVRATLTVSNGFGYVYITGKPRPFALGSGGAGPSDPNPNV